MESGSHTKAERNRRKKENAKKKKEEAKLQETKQKELLDGLSKIFIRKSQQLGATQTPEATDRGLVEKSAVVKHEKFTGKSCIDVNSKRHANNLVYRSLRSGSRGQEITGKRSRSVYYSHDRERNGDLP
jgi:hypothetical protein